MKPFNVETRSHEPGILEVVWDEPAEKPLFYRVQWLKTHPDPRQQTQSQLVDVPVGETGKRYTNLDPGDYAAIVFAIYTEDVYPGKHILMHSGPVKVEAV